MHTVLNAYDLMAVICHKIRQLSERTQKTIYRAYWATPKLVCSTIEYVFPFLKNTSNGNGFLYDSLSLYEIDEILDKIESWANTSSDNKMLIYLLGYLDRKIVFEKSIDNFIQSIPCRVPKVHRFECLNGNAMNCWGKLLPRFEPAWKKGNNRSGATLMEDPLSIMQHYFWVQNTHRWEIANVYSSEWECHALKNFTVVCSPITNRPTFDYEKELGKDCGYFKITNYHEEDQRLILERIEKTLAIAKKNQASIVLFPEMIASRDCQMNSQKIVRANWHYSFPRILCLPSSEFKENEIWKNQTVILDDSGHKLFQYNKQTPFQLDEKQEENSNIKPDPDSIFRFFEPITPDYTLTILHIKGLGRIGIIICADIFNEELCDILLNKYEIRLLLIMAYTAGYDQFFRSISMAQKTSCEVIWCNSCAAYTAFGKTGPAVAYFSYGHKNCVEKTVPHCHPCDSTLCNGCSVTITINPLYSEPGTVSFSPLD